MEMINLPDGFKENMKKLLSEEEYELLESSYSDESVSSLRMNPLKKTGNSHEDLNALFSLEKIPYEETGYYFAKEDNPGRSPYHNAGAYYIQDPGAMVPGALLKYHLKKTFGEEIPDLRILDLCASPGGKSTQIAMSIAGNGILFSNEINRTRAEVLSENIERCGIANTLVLNETSASLSERFAGFFDAIIADAPCSGEGMFRKDPEAVKQWSAENVETCVERQKEILENAYIMLKPGGALVYSTCTFERSENEDRVLELINIHPDMRVANIDEFKKSVPGSSDGLEGCAEAMRMWPMHFKGEGQFAVLLIKDGEGERSIPFGGYESASALKLKKPLEEFLKNTLKGDTASMILDCKDRFRLFGDNLYIMPADTPSLSGLKVLRCGLHLGSFKKDRFEPSHAFALFLGEGDVINSVRVNETDAENYVKGMTLEGEGNGWCLVSLGGYSLGWGKASGGRIKNHYPKGLRVPG